MSVQQIERTASALPATRQTRVLLIAAFCVALGLYYTLLLSNGSLSLFGPEQFDHVFGSMLTHLLHGEFTVDPNAIGSESFTRDGKTYAYFGVFPALLRLLAMPFVDVTQTGLARISCIAAILLFVIIQLRSLVLVHNAVEPGRRSAACLGIMVVAIALSGPQIYLLGSAWIYHEPVFWSAAMGAAYNLVILRAVSAEKPIVAKDLAMLALLAGLALHTRASVGVALCVTTTLLAVWLAWNSRPARSGLGATARSMIADPRILAPFFILAFFVVAVGVINYGRWGSPFRFADFRFYDFAKRQPWRMTVILEHGELDPSRIPIAALYYATGIPYVLKNMAPFAGYLRTHFDGLEAPPLSGLITNPLIVVLAGLGLYRVIRFPPKGAAVLRLALLGHCFAVLLVCCAMYLAMRYRMDFAPFMTLAAFVGYPMMSGAMEMGPRRRAVLCGAVALCALSVVSSHYVLVIHKVWSQGVPLDIRRQLLPLAPFAHAALEQ